MADVQPVRDISVVEPVCLPVGTYVHYLLALPMRQLAIAELITPAQPRPALIVFTNCYSVPKHPFSLKGVVCLGPGPVVAIMISLQPADRHHHQERILGTIPLHHVPVRQCRALCAQSPV
jgi:hypothetical protein